MYNKNEITDEFVAEAKEHLIDIEKVLMMIEQNGYAADQEIISQIFRSIHSIKGGAGFLGFYKMNELAHVMETLLDMLRNKKLVPDRNNINAVFSGTDLLHSMTNDIQKSNSVDIKETYDTINDILNKSGKIKDRKDPVYPSEVTEVAEEDLAFTVTQAQLDSIPKNTNELFLLKFDFTDIGKTIEMSPVSFIRKLLSAGVIIEGKIHTPAISLTEDLSRSPLLCHLLYATILDKELLEMMSGLPEKYIIPVQKDSLLEPTPEDPFDVPPPAIEETLNAGTDNDQKTQTGEVIKSCMGKTTKSSETIRVNVDILDQLMALAGELVLVRNQHLQAFDKTDSKTRNISQRLDMVTTELQESIMRTRMQPVGNAFAKLARMVRDLSNKLSKKIEIITSGNDVEVDKTILEALTDPLTHLIRNCCDHGIEQPVERKKTGKRPVGKIQVTAYHEAGQINIEITDDGRGINAAVIREKALQKGLKTEQQLSSLSEKELINLILLPGFSTAEKVSDISGRGVGMDVVKTCIENIGGILELDSNPGKGTKVLLRLPLTLAIIPSLIVKSGEYRYAIPQVNLEELVCIYKEEITSKIEFAGDMELCRLRDDLLTMVRLNEVFNRKERFTAAVKKEINANVKLLYQDIENIPNDLHFAVVKSGKKRFGLIVDKVLGNEEIVVKPMHPHLKGLKIYSGATVMGDGRIALILDIEGISEHVGIELSCHMETATSKLLLEGKDNKVERHSILLCRSGEKEQFAVPLPLIKRIEHINTDAFEYVGKKTFVTIEGVSTLVIRVDDFMDVSPLKKQKEYFLLVPKHAYSPFGILMSKLIDVDEIPFDLLNTNYIIDGLMGSSTVRDTMTLFLDIYYILEKAEPDFREKQPKGTYPTRGTGQQILLVEDSPFFLHLVKEYLETFNYRIYTAENGKNALDILGQSEVDLIVSDIEMPLLDGFEFMREVRNHDRFKNIPAVALTALHRDEDRKKAKNAGFNDYQIKLNREKLLFSVSSLLKSQTEPAV